MLESVEAVTPSGRIKTPPVPAMAVGPSMQQMLLGSEGTLGVITQATVRIHRPEEPQVQALLFPDWESGCAAVQAIAQSHTRTSLVRLSDAAEPRCNGAPGVPTPRPSIARAARVTRWVLDEKGCCLAVAALCFWVRRKRVAQAGRAHDRKRHGFIAGESPARQWLKNRFVLPFLRDTLMDHGVLNDTLETSARWSRLQEVYRAGCEALKEAVGHPGIVLCHVSHVYPDGASLYFTFITPRPATQELEHWARIRDRAVTAFLQHGGALSHHHGVGSAHARWLPQALGDPAVSVLRALKRSLDPQDILNPGKLLPSVPQPTSEGVL